MSGHQVCVHPWGGQKCPVTDDPGCLLQKSADASAALPHQKSGCVGLAFFTVGRVQPEGMTLRSDNGAQFVAGVVRQYLKEKGVYQEFTHVATPQDNGYMEALHSSLQREAIDRFELEWLAEA